MRILALETSGRLGDVALLQSASAGPEVLAERATPPDQRTAQSLLPTVRQLLDDAGWKPSQLDAICVTTGPGSFTGLRIGVVTAKTLAYATGAQLVGVHTLSAMAAGVDRRDAPTWAILDAQRQELFAAKFMGPDVDPLTPPTEILPIADFLARLAPGEMVTGPPLAKLAPSLPTGVVAADPSQWQPTAAATGLLGVRLLEQGLAINPLEMVPNYYRKSAAEEKKSLGAQP